MIEYDNDNEEMEMECDECGDSMTFYGDFTDCIDDAKRDGWRISGYNRYGKSGTEYIHTCSNCWELQHTSEDGFTELDR